MCSLNSSELFMSDMDAGENLNQTVANEMPSSEQEVSAKIYILYYVLFFWKCH